MLEVDTAPVDPWQERGRVQVATKPRSLQGTREEDAPSERETEQHYRRRAETRAWSTEPSVERKHWLVRAAGS